MRKLLFSLCLMLISALANAQAFKGTPANGISIKTNMPSTNGSPLTTASIGLILNYYIIAAKK